MHLRTLAIAILTAMLLVAACNGPETGDAPGGSPASPPAGNGDGAPAGEALTVALVNNAFEPDSVTIPRGGQVTWNNTDQANHTVTHGTGGEPHGDAMFDMPLTPGTQASYTFAEAGSFPVTCTIHPQMQMDVTVTP